MQENTRKQAHCGLTFKGVTWAPPKIPTANIMQPFLTINMAAL